MKQQRWYHGTTSKETVQKILKEGFRVETWFARHMENAVTFGGPYVFTVRVVFDETPMRWQALCSNVIPASAIESVRFVKTIVENQHG